MKWLLEPRARSALPFLSRLILLLFLASCATAPSSKYVGPDWDLMGSGGVVTFAALWSKWTLYLSAATEGGGLGRLRISLLTDGGSDRAGGNRGFPLQIAATLMDSVLIESGLRYYAHLLEMTSEEQVEFRLSIHC